MAKSYGSAQNQTIGVFQDPSAGFMRLSLLAREMGKVLPTSKAVPSASSCLINVVTKTKIPSSRLFGKILSSSSRGIRILVSSGRSSDQAAHAPELYYVNIDTKTVKVKSIKKIPNPFLKILEKRKEIEAQQKKQNKGRGSSSNQSRDSNASTSRRSKNSYRNRRSRRRYRRMDRSRTREKIPEQVSIDLVEPESMPTEEETFQAEPKDFSDLLQTANKALYEESVPEDTQPVVMPGTDQYLGLGINVDRPSVICMTRPNTDLVTGGTIFEDLLAERFLRLENAFNLLAALEETPDFDAIKELYDLKLEQTDQVLKVLENVNNVEIEIKGTLRGDADEELSAFDYTREQNSTQAYLQAVWDLAKFPFRGSVLWRRRFKPESGHSRKLEQQGVSVKAPYNWWWPQDLRYYSTYKYYVRIDNKDIPFLETAGEINPDSFQGGFVASLQNSGAEHNKGVYISPFFSITRSTGGSKNTSIPHVCQLVWTEMMLSKLASAEHEAALYVKDNQHSNFAPYFLGGIDLNNSIMSIETPSKLGSVAKFISSGQTYFPFEESVSSIKQRGYKVPITGKTFYSDVLRPALGDVVEGREYNIDVITEWMEAAGVEIGEYLDFTDLFTETGGPLLVLNEVVLAVLSQLTDDDPFSHPISAVYQNTMKDRTWDTYYRHLLLRSIAWACGGDKLAGTMVYNTMSYNGSPWDIYWLGKNVASRAFKIYHERNQYLDALETLKKEAEDSDEIDIRLSPSDDNDGVQLVNTAYCFMNSLFEKIEIGLSNSITTLLADKGIVETETDLNYSSLVDGFYETDDKGVERTVCFGIPKFEFRLLLWRIIYALMRMPETVGFSYSSDEIESFWAEIAALAVTNINPDDGPYRWGISRGAPLDGVPVTDQIDEEFFTDLVPQSVQEALTDGASDEDGDGVIQDDENPITSDWEFLQSDEVYCPLTYVLEGEDAGMDVQRVVFGNRGPWTTICDDFIEYRTYAISYRNFLSSIVPPYEEIPALLDGLAQNDSTKMVQELAQYPGIEGQDVVNFTGKVQDFNRRKDIMINKGQEAFKFMPAKYAKTTSEFLCAKAVLQEVFAEFIRPETVKFHSIGIPCGLIENVGDPYEPFNLRKYGTFAFFMDFEFSSVDTMFQPNIYLVPGSLGECDPEAGLSGILQKAQFLVVKESTQSFLPYESVKEYLDVIIESSGKNAKSEDILKNHLISYCIQECIEIMNGMVLNENTFRFDKKLPNILVEGDVQKVLATLIKNPPDSIADWFEDVAVKSIMEIMAIDSEISASELASVLVALESRFISAATIPASVMGVRLFDRVFHVITHPNQFEVVKKIRSGASELGLKELDGEQKIDMEDEPHGNKLYNDHIASYSFELEG